MRKSGGKNDSFSHEEEEQEQQYYSEDSFITELTDEDAVVAGDHDPRHMPLSAYISPTSSTSELERDKSSIHNNNNNNNNEGGRLLIGVTETLPQQQQQQQQQLTGGHQHYPLEAASAPLPPPPPVPPMPPPAATAAAAAAVPPHDTIDQQQQQQQQQQTRHRKHSSDGPMWTNMAPAHPFFGSAYEQDSDVSEGSFIVHHGQQQQYASPTMANTVNRKRSGKDRFPSFDSLGSTGSLAFVSPRTSSLPTPQPQTPTQTIKPHMLPYHERRKLMQQRQQEEQQGMKQPPQQQQQPQAPQQPPVLHQQQQQQPMMPYGMQQHVPFPPDIPGSYGQPFPVVPGQQHQQQQQQMYMQPYPPPGGMAPYPMHPGMPPPPYPPHSQQQYQQYQQYQQPQEQQQQQQQQQFPLPYRGGPMGGSTGAGSSNIPPRFGANRIPRPPPPLRTNSGSSAGDGLPRINTNDNYNGNNNDNYNNNNHGIPPPPPPPPPPPTSRFFGRGRSSSLDSSDGGMEQQGATGLPPSNSRRSSKEPPPPPPPPPPPQNPPGHVRHESSGSVSSLGSLDRSIREENDSSEPGQQTPRAGADASNRSNNIFARFNPFAAPKPKQPLNEFHRKNQEFLAKVERQQGQHSPSVVASGNHKTAGIAGFSPKQQLSKGSPTRPPPTGGRYAHQRLHSIGDDNWEEGGTTGSSPDLDAYARAHGGDAMQGRRSREESSSDGTDYELDSSEPYNAGGSSDADADERTRLLPPSGISTNEYYDKSYVEDSRRNRSRRSQSGGKSSRSNLNRISASTRSSAATTRADNTTATAVVEYQRQLEEDARRQKKKKKKKKRSSKYRARKQREARSGHDSSDESASSTTESSHDYQSWMSKRARILEKERSKLIMQWREEARAEEEAERREKENNRWYRRLSRQLDGEAQNILSGSFKFFAWFEQFIANLPLTIGAVALAIVNLGVDWFKFAEENLDSCEPVHFHSSQCSFPEFPGCFYCDTNERMYKVAVHFHFTCSVISGILVFAFLSKLLFAWNVVLDELASPTTATPAGLVCQALEVVFAGRGFMGMLVVSAASFVHFCIAIWFIYLVLAYHIMPDPSWFPNTVAIGISAVKTWLYFPMAGHFLMAMSLTLNFFFFPISLIRVALNRKISATVGWMTMAAPNISLYSLTIMAQPSFEEEHPDVTHFQKVHRMVYLPFMHFLFGLCLIGVIGSIVSLITRWKEFTRLPFSPAHVAFCCPTLSHANAIQAYRAAINSFGSLPHNSPFQVAIYVYWLVSLCVGTFLTVTISTMFIYSLPKWTHFDVEDDVEPPAPYETSMTLSNMISTGDNLVQPFVSPAVLQANETGALVLTRFHDGRQHYVRTRKVTALGFEPIMDMITLEREREILLEHVALHPPRRRNRTLSVPGIDFSYGANLGTDNSGVYGMQPPSPNPGGPGRGRGGYRNRARASTMSPSTGLANAKRATNG